MSEHVSSPVLGSYIWETLPVGTTQGPSGSPAVPQVENFLLLLFTPLTFQMPSSRMPIQIWFILNHVHPNSLGSFFIFSWNMGTSAQSTQKWKVLRLLQLHGVDSAAEMEFFMKPTYLSRVHLIEVFSLQYGLYLTASKWFFLVLLKEPDPSHKFSINGIINWYNFKSKNAEPVCGKHKHVFGVRCKLV